MKKIIYILLLAGMSFISTPSLAQETPPADTTVITPTITTPVNEKEIGSGLETLRRYQEENRAKQKKAAMIRIGIGVAFLIVLVIGLSRRRKK